MTQNRLSSIRVIGQWCGERQSTKQKIHKGERISKSSKMRTSVRAALGSREQFRPGPSRFFPCVLRQLSGLRYCPHKGRIRIRVLGIDGNQKSLERRWLRSCTLSEG